MTQPNRTQTQSTALAAGPGRRLFFRFTPAQWRRVIEDSAFLRRSDNSYIPPRRYLGLAVEIVPDGDFR